jgi:hypothetical protein
MESYVFPDNVTIQGDGTEVHPLRATPINTALSNIRTNRTVYHITAPDVAAGYADIPVVWAVPFPDVAYTIAQAITQDGPLDLINDFSPGDNHLVTGAGFTAQIYVNAAAVAGTVIILHTIGIHD